MAVEAFFLPMSSGQRFCLLHRPEPPSSERGAVVFIHPFTEEMNKSRRMVALQARALAAAGYSVLQIDLEGCGDSSGSFADATWSAWVEDVVRACHWFRCRTGAPLWLWGLRAGCLVAVAAARELEWPVNFLFWQPTASGKLFLQQFLRLKMASALLDGEAKGNTQALRQQLLSGEPVEVAGYWLSPDLATGLDQSDLMPTNRPVRVEWIEMASQPGAGLTPASQKMLDSWRKIGHQIHWRVVPGQAFWQTVEITECAALVEATIDILEEETCS